MPRRRRPPAFPRRPRPRPTPKPAGDPALAREAFGLALELFAERLTPEQLAGVRSRLGGDLAAVLEAQGFPIPEIFRTPPPDDGGGAGPSPEPGGAMDR